MQVFDCILVIIVAPPPFPAPPPPPTFLPPPCLYSPQPSMSPPSLPPPFSAFTLLPSLPPPFPTSAPFFISPPFQIITNNPLVSFRRSLHSVELLCYPQPLGLQRKFLCLLRYICPVTVSLSSIVYILLKLNYIARVMKLKLQRMLGQKLLVEMNYSHRYLKEISDIK